MRPWWPALAFAVLLGGCGGGTTGAPPLPVAGTGCLDTRAASAVWADVNRRIAAIQMDPNHAGLSDATTGLAATRTDRYIADTLVGHHLTEREQDRLDSLRVLNGACSPGEPLIIEVRVTLVRDDYLSPDGHVDHVDPGVGKQTHDREAYRLVGSTWKLSDLEDLDAPAPSLPPGTV